MPRDIPPGVLLVAAPPPSDLDVMYVAASPDALGLEPISLETTRWLFEQVPCEPALIPLSALAACVFYAHTNQAKQRRLVTDVFGEGRPVHDLLLRFMDAGRNHLAFSAQQITIATRLLIEHGGPETGRLLTDSEVDHLLMALVAVGSLNERPDEPTIHTNTPESWVPWPIRSGRYFDRRDLGSEQARAHALFVELFENSDPHVTDWCDLSAWMREDLADAAEQHGFGYAIGAFTRALEPDLPFGDRNVAIQPAGLLAGQIRSEAVEKLLDASSGNRGEFQRTFAADGGNIEALVWDSSPFEERPLFRLSDDRLILLSPSFLHSWMGEGYYYRLLSSARRRRRPGGKENLVNQFTQFHGRLMERYVVALSRDAHQTQVAAGIVRVAEEQLYDGRPGTECRSPDLVLSYATDAVAVEVTGGRLPRNVDDLSDPAPLFKALREKVIEKLDELDKAMRDILDGYVAPDGFEPGLCERFWPVVVVPGTILQGDLVWDHIRAQSPGLFDHPRLMPPTLLAVDDYETAMAAVEKGDGLPQLLALRASSPYAQMPPSHFFSNVRPGLGRPTYVNRHFQQFSFRAFLECSARRPSRIERTNIRCFASSLDRQLPGPERPAGIRPTRVRKPSALRASCRLTVLRLASRGLCLAGFGCSYEFWISRPKRRS